VRSIWTTWSASGFRPSRRKMVGATWVVLTYSLELPERTVPGAYTRIGTRPPALPGYSGSLPANAFIEPYGRLLRLPTNVDALWQLLYREAGRGSAAWKRHEMFTEIGDLLREDPIPAKVRAALYLVAARIPGIRLVGLTRDGIGRPALAVALNDTLYGERSELLFDPTTSALLGERSVVVRPPPAYHVKPGAVHYGATYITAGIVERIGQVPARPSTP
jgi:hypothetical protein